MIREQINERKKPKLGCEMNIVTSTFISQSSFDFERSNLYFEPIYFISLMNVINLLLNSSGNSTCGP